MPDLTLKQLSDVLNVGEGNLRRRMRQGLVPGVYKFGNQYRIREEAVQEIRNTPARKADPTADAQETQP